MIDSPPSGYLAALLRLWTLRAVPPGRLKLWPSLLCLLLWTVMWVGYDGWTLRPAPTLRFDAIPLFAWYALAVILFSAALAAWTRPKMPFASAFALSAALTPWPLAWMVLAPALPSNGWYWCSGALLCLYLLAFLLRGLKSLSGAPQRALAVGAWLFVIGFVLLSDDLDVVPGLWLVPETSEPAASSDNALADQEQLLFGQSAKIDAAVAALSSDPSARPKTFFIGFAGVGGERVFAQEIELAARELGTRFDTAARSLKLINDERDVDSAPLASVAALKYSLKAVAARMNVDRDVLFLSISSHGSPDPEIAVENSDLPLDPLTDTALAEALEASGIKWRVIVISACYAGGFVESLQNPHTIVITAAAKDRTSFGCGVDSELTYFGEAFYRDALPQTHSLREAFETAKAAIALRERREHVEASKPQAFFGSEIEDKLRSMEKPAS
jgi:Peptidase C13 family